MGLFRKRCKTSGCPNLHRNENGYCDVCNARRSATYRYRRIMATDTPMERRPSANERGYGSRWRRFAKDFLIKNPKCAICGKPAKVCDHKNIPAPVMLDMYGSFSMDPDEYQPLCVSCNTRKAAEDKKVIQSYFKQKHDMFLHIEGEGSE